MSGIKQHVPGTAEHRATHPPGTGVTGEVKSHVPGTAEHTATRGAGAGYAGTGAAAGERYAEGYEKTAYPHGTHGPTAGATGAGYEAGAVLTAGGATAYETGTATGAGYAPQVTPSVPVEGPAYTVEPGAAGAIGTTTSTVPVGATTGGTYETYEGEGGRGAYGATGTTQRAGRTVETASGEVHEHRTTTGAALDQAWQKTKEAVPGTKEHGAAHGTATGTTGYTGHATGTGRSAV